MAANPADLSTVTIVVRVAGGALLGGVIGFEREIDGHEAGTRTHFLLALGAALLGAISVAAFDDFVTTRADTNIQVDVTRVASYVAAGIGFLGGGAIVKRSDRIEGLTTAASLWVAASIGLAAGLGFWPGAIGVTVLALLALFGDRPLARLTARVGRRRSRLLTVTFPAGRDPRSLLADVLDTCGPHVARVSVNEAGAGGGPAILVELHKEASGRDIERYMAVLAAHEDILQVSRG
ncbi:MAG TPA: MgtC/SapB family protein [Acidimicrobiales bacterium]|nr:MgtC/SapB family protein [Acidimicrobiales bacterium]